MFNPIGTAFPLSSISEAENLPGAPSFVPTDRSSAGRGDAVFRRFRLWNHRKTMGKCETPEENPWENGGLTSRKP